MITRPLVAAFAVVTLSLGIASATSLGTLNAIAFSASTIERTPCTVGSVQLIEAVPVGLPLDLVSLPLSVTFDRTIASVGLTGLAGDCDGLIPVVTIIGSPPATLVPNPVLGALPALIWVTQPPSVLSTDALGALGPGADQTVAVAPSAGLHSILLDATQVTELRVAFVSVAP